MRVVHLSTSDRGGAGVVAARLHQSLLEQSIDSHLLTGYKFTEGIPYHVLFQESDTVGYSMADRASDSLKHVLKQMGIISSPNKKYSKNYLMGKSHGYEYFSFPYSDKHLEKHPLIRSADIVHLHWVSEDFLNQQPLTHF